MDHQITEVERKIPPVWLLCPCAFHHLSAICLDALRFIMRNPRQQVSSDAGSGVSTAAASRKRTGFLTVLR